MKAYVIYQTIELAIALLYLYIIFEQPQRLQSTLPELRIVEKIYSLPFKTLLTLLCATVWMLKTLDKFITSTTAILNGLTLAEF